MRWRMSHCRRTFSSCWPRTDTAFFLEYRQGSARGSDCAGRPWRPSRLRWVWRVLRLQRGACLRRRSALNKAPGNLTGQGIDQFGAKWYVVGKDGKKIDND